MALQQSVFPGLPWLPTFPAWHGPALTLDVSHTFTFTLDSVDVTRFVDPDSVQMNDVEGSEVETLYLEMVARPETLWVEALSEITWVLNAGTDDELLYFGGLVIHPERSLLPDGGLLWRVKCEGYSTLLARAEAPAQVYVQQYPGAIVRDLLDRAGLTSQDTEQGAVAVLLKSGAPYLRDSSQEWSDWQTTSGAAQYAVVLTHNDGSVSWAWLGAGTGTDIAVYTDRTLVSAGWLGVDPATCTPVSYHVRRAANFSGSRPVDVTSAVVTGTTTLTAFAAASDETLAAVLTRLADDAGWVWRLDATARLYFGPAKSDPAPFEVSNGAGSDYDTAFPARGGTLVVADNATDFFNRVVIHGGAKDSAVVTEAFYGMPGNNGVFRLSHRNLIDITVLVNGDVVADGTAWWNTFGDRVVLVNYAEGWIWFNEPMLWADVVCHYRYWEPLVYELRDEESIAATRQTITKSVYDSRIYDVETASVRAAALLAAVDEATISGSFEVWRLGLRAGQLLTLTFPDAGLEGKYVVRKVDVRIDSSGDGLICYVQFGGRQSSLSGVVDAWRWRGTDVRLGTLSNLINRTTARLMKPSSSSVTLTRHDAVTLVDGSSEDVDVRLPPAAAALGEQYVVVRVDGGGYDVTVLPADSETINGAGALTLTQWQSARLYSDGTMWVLV